MFQTKEGARQTAAAASQIKSKPKSVNVVVGKQFRAHTHANTHNLIVCVLKFIYAFISFTFLPFFPAPPPNRTSWKLPK